MVDNEPNTYSSEPIGPPQQNSNTERAIIPSTKSGYENRAIVPYKQRRHLPAEVKSPVQSITLGTYFLWKLHGFTPKQTADIVKTAWEENRNMIRERHVGEKLLVAMEEEMGDELDHYSATPEGLLRLKDKVTQIQRAKDMLLGANTNPSYRDLIKLRNYEPEEIADMVEDLKAAKCKYPVWVLAQLADAAKKSGTTLENLVDRRLHQGSDGRSGFEDLDYIIDGEE